SYVGRSTVPEGRGHLLRARRMLQALPLSAVAHHLPGEAAPTVPRHRAGGDRRNCGRTGGRPARRHLRGRRGRLAADHRAVRARQGEPRGLLDWPLVPSRLGGADDEPPPGRPDRAPGRDVLSPHPGHLAGAVGARDQREFLGHPAWGRALLPRSPAASRQGVTGLSALRVASRPSPLTPTVDYDRDGVQHGFLRLPYSRDDSAWGAG